MNYKKYLFSREWLLKKNELLNDKIKNEEIIQCFLCGSTDKLLFHHWSYKNIGNEKLEDLEIFCSDCHTRWHTDPEWKREIEKELEIKY